MKGTFNQIMAPRLMRKLFKEEPSLEKTVAQCQEFQFNDWITYETIWNTAYQLGRKRWYWGPLFVFWGPLYEWEWWRNFRYWVFYKFFAPKVHFTVSSTTNAAENTDNN